MADTIVSVVVTNIAQLLVNEANLLLGVEDQIRSLQTKLPYIQNFLKDSEGKRDQHNVMQLVKDIRNVSREVEDIVDEYVVKVDEHNRKNPMKKFFRGFNEAKFLHDVSVKITSLEKMIADIYDNYDKYKIQRQTDINESNDEELQKQILVQRRRNKVEEDVVGFVKETKTLVGQLIEGTDELDVISILGMGGLGKTTLARKVYKDTSVADCFRCRAWVSVSQNFKLKELLIEILKQVALMTEEMMGEMPTMSEDQLKKALNKELSHNRYLVVLDDLWNKGDWDQLNDAFPKDGNGSRVFITTRMKDVALQSIKNPPLELDFLGKDESWELFTKKVFRREPCPADLVTVGKEIVEKCKGLPLAIVVVAGLLEGREKTHDEWESMRRGVVVDIKEQTPCHDILGLSYNELPSHLKPCFLYLGLFPEDHKIPATKLIQLWISEGFIEKEDGREHRKEDVAKSYLHQLIARSLIQVDDTGSDGGVKTCRVHDLIRDLCIRLSKEENFLETHENVPSHKTQPRRLSVHHISRRDYIADASSANTRHVRTLLCFSQDKHTFSENHWEKLFEKLRLLRVLDLGDKEVQRVPKDINRLILLKYLRVITATVAGVPSTIYRLRNLLTLDLRCTRIDVLPGDLWDMQELRHLYLNGPTRLPPNPDQRRLHKLQTLYYVSKDPMERVHIAQSAPNLRKLGLHGYRCNSGEDKSTFDLEYLESLKFVNECRFYKGIELPKSVTSISIKGKACPDTKTIRTFQGLPMLRILKFDGVKFTDDELVFGEDYFPELEFLKIENSSIEAWKLGGQAPAKLKKVVISNCKDLVEFPKDKLLAVSTLQELKLSRLPDKITKAIAATKRSDKLKLDIYPPVQL